MLSLTLLPAVASLVLGTSPAAPAPQNLKGRTERGHRSVFSVEVVYPDGTKRNEMLESMSTGGTDFVLLGQNDQGADVSLWLDTIASLDAVGSDHIKVAFRSGKSLDLHGREGSYYEVNFARPDDGQDTIRFDKIKRIRFLHPARRDALGNALFDAWLYSPYTGKRVP